MNGDDDEGWRKVEFKEEGPKDNPDVTQAEDDEVRTEIRDKNNRWRTEEDRGE